MKSIPKKRYFRVDEVAEYFSVTKRHIYNLIEARRIRAIRIGKCVRIPYSEIEKYERKLR